MKKILFVGMHNSPHAARWIKGMQGLGYEIYFFPVLVCPPVENLSGVTLFEPAIKLAPLHFIKEKIIQPETEAEKTRQQLITQPISRFPITERIEDVFAALRSRPFGHSHSTAPWMLSPKKLARIIRRVKPDLIHSLEIQHAGYRVLEARKNFKNGEFPAWLVTNWGSDIYYYQRFPDHHKDISEVLKACDYYSCECKRDVKLAKGMGFSGKVMPVLPNSGGIDVKRLHAQFPRVEPSKRRGVMIKGYQHFAGRALTALEALVKIKDKVSDFTFILFSTSETVAETAKKISAFHNLDVRVLEHCSHDDIMEYFANARVYLGVSISDALSTSMVEAMSMGCFPIQTDTACCDEWLEDGKTGFIVSPDRTDQIADRLLTALEDDELVNHAAEENYKVVKQRLDLEIVSAKQAEFYKSIFD